MADPKQFGVMEWGVVGFILVVLLGAVAALWRQLLRERRAFQATVERVAAEHAGAVGVHVGTIQALVAEHRREMMALVDRERAASDKHVEKYQMLTEKMVTVLDAFSRRLDKRQRTERGGA